MKKLFLKLIRFYQKNISPLKPPSCRFSPSCSVYTAQAIEKFGAPKGCLMGFFRIMRCCPLFPGGYDPVPDKWPQWGKKNRQQNAGQDADYSEYADDPEYADDADYTEYAEYADGNEYADDADDPATAPDGSDFNG